VQVVEVNVKVESAGTHNVHNNAFYAEEKLLKSELQAMRDCDPSSVCHWIVRALFSCFNILLFLPALLYHYIVHPIPGHYLYAYMQFNNDENYWLAALF
jgi:hypothetical protein